MPGSLDDHRLVRHGRDVGSSRGAGAHDDRHLGDPLGGHARLVVEDPPEVLAVGKDIGLEGQKGAARIDQVHAGQAVLLGDLLGAQVLLDGHRVVGAALDRGVVGDDHHLAAGDAADSRDEAGAGRLAAVHPVGRQRRELEEGEPGSSSASTLSRTNIFFCSAWRSRPAPPSRARASSR